MPSSDRSSLAYDPPNRELAPRRLSQPATASRLGHTDENLRLDDWSRPWFRAVLLSEGVELDESYWNFADTLDEAFTAVDSVADRTCPTDLLERWVSGTIVRPPEETELNAIWRSIVATSPVGSVPTRRDRFIDFLYGDRGEVWLVLDQTDPGTPGIVKIDQIDRRNGKAYFALHLNAQSQRSKDLALVNSITFVAKYAVAQNMRKLYWEVPSERLNALGTGVDTWFAVEGVLRRHEVVRGTPSDVSLCAFYTDRLVEAIERVSPCLIAS